MRMLCTCIDLELAELGAAQACLRDHSPDSLLNKENWTAKAELLWSLNFLTADIAGETGVNLVGFFVTGEHALISVDHDNEITGVDVAGENWLMLAAE